MRKMANMTVDLDDAEHVSEHTERAEQLGTATELDQLCNISPAEY